MSTLMFWNKQNTAANQGNEQKNGKRNWLHTPDVLVNGHVAYPVKFLGSTPVDQPKGIEVVKEAIRRLQFSQQIKKAESGNNAKTKKVEITVSINGVAVQENKGQVILHQFPLHKISYCADEKGAKKFFSFIAKTGSVNGTTVPNSDSVNSADEGHECFVFISNKLASDITLTIGQAFDLAYRRYITDSGKTNGGDPTKVQIQAKHLENVVSLYRNRLKELTDILPKSELDKILLKLGLKDIYEVPYENGVIDDHIATINGSKLPEIGIIDISIPNNDDQLLIETTAPKQHFPPTVPPRNFQNPLNNTFEALKPSVGTKLEGLLLNSDSDSDFDPRASECETNGNNKIANDLFGFEPPKTMGQQLFNNGNGHGNGNGNLITNGTTSSPPPLLAPPPKAAIPRRSVPLPIINNNNNNNNNNINNKINQDLFGSAPFISNSSPFDVTGTSDEFTTNFSNIDETVITTTAMPSTTLNPDFNNINVANPFMDVTVTVTDYQQQQQQHQQHNINPVINDITAFANNFDKLDNILKNNINTMNTIIAPIPITDNNNNINNNNNLNNNNLIINNNKDIKDNLLPTIKSNPFNIVRPISPKLNDIKIMDTTTPVKHIKPTFSRTDSFLNRNKKYDAFKNAIDFESFTMGTTKEKIIKIEKIPEIPTKNAGGFKEFNFNEFSNQLIESANMNIINNKNDKQMFGQVRQNNFNNSNGLNFGTDDFTLESLDPLRK